MRGFVLVFAMAGVGFAQGQQIAVGNAASFAQGTVAPGSLMEIGLTGTFVGTGALPTIDPSTVSVSLQPLNSYSVVNLSVVSVGQPFGPVVALVPANTPLGGAMVTLSMNGTVYPSSLVEIAASNFGLFTNGVNGMGPARALSVAANGAAVTNQLTHPALTHQYVTLWGTGLGNATRDQVRVLLGGKQQTVLYAGAAPGEPGVDQINFFVSADPTIPNGCYVALQVQAAGTLSNATSISKAAAAGACENPLGLTAAEMATLDAGGAVNFAALDVSATITPAQRATAAAPGGFARNENASFVPATGLNAASVAAFTEPLVADDVLFGCEFQASQAAGTPAFIRSTGGISFGSEVILSGGGRTLAMTSNGSPVALYSGSEASATASDPSQLPVPTFTAGPWEFSGTGAPAFQQQLTFSPEIAATNFGALQTIGRTRDLAVKWNAAGFGANDMVTATLQEVLNSQWFSGGGVIVCRAPALKGQIVFPASLLGQLPSSIGVQGLAPTLSLAVGAKPGTAEVFSLPSGPSALPLPAVFRQSSVETWPVAIQ